MSISSDRVRYEYFRNSAFEDQKLYYQKTRDRFSKSFDQVNRIRALLAFSTGVAAALAGILVQNLFVKGAVCEVAQEANNGICGTFSALVSLLTILAVVLPSLAAFFNTLIDLFQWDRVLSIYETAGDALENATAPLEPELIMYERKASADGKVKAQTLDQRYLEQFKRFAETTLAVMQDEQVQWGKSMRTSEQLQKFVDEQVANAEKLANPKAQT